MAYACRVLTEDLIKDNIGISADFLKVLQILGKNLQKLLKSQNSDQNYQKTQVKIFRTQIKIIKTQIKISKTQIKISKTQILRHFNGVECRGKCTKIAPAVHVNLSSIRGG